ncbi:MAG: ATP-binding protein [Candidatus Gastranaerophilales bacterium]|nr:ATP-binding protein [Candidatus Gastranaerophilales bacterium]
MRIGGISVGQNSSNVSFGYNRTLNQELVKILNRGKNRIVRDELLELNAKCNELEDILDETTRGKRLNAKGYYSERIENLISLFVSLKIAFMGLVDELLPDLHFPQREFLHYVAKADDGQSWLKGTIDDLNITVDANPSTPDGVQSTVNAVNEAVNLTPSSNATLQAANVKKIISEHLPTKESPEGLASIVGMHEIKGKVISRLVKPLQSPAFLTADEAEYGIKLPRATLFHGPPGCGKTFLAEAIARELDLPLFKLKIGRAGSKYINGTSQNYEAAFSAVAARAQKEEKPCFLFIDEIEGQTSSRGRSSSSNEEHIKSVGTLLDLINTARSRNIIVLGATNNYDLVDEAIRSRFDFQIPVGLPDLQTRTAVLRKVLKGKTKAAKLATSEQDLAKIAEKFDGFSIRSIVDLSNAAMVRARDDARRAVTVDDYLQVIAENQDAKIKNPEQYLPEKPKGKMRF